MKEDELLLRTPSPLRPSLSVTIFCCCLCRRLSLFSKTFTSVRLGIPSLGIIYPSLILTRIAEGRGGGSGGPNRGRGVPGGCVFE